MSRLTTYPRPDSARTRSRKFSDHEIKLLDQIIEAGYGLHLIPKERRRLDELRADVKALGYFRGFSLWQHSHRLGPFVMVTFHSPENIVPSPGRRGRPGVTRPNAGDFRRGLYGLLESHLGQGFSLGLRHAPHTGRKRGRHVHFLVSLIRFPDYLWAWAKAFKGQSLDIKSQWLPAFFPGPHLDPAIIEPALAEPYRAFLEPFYGEFEDDPATLVHMQESEKEFPDEANREGAAGYLNRPWKEFDTVELVGFAPHGRGKRVLLRRKNDKKKKYDEHLENFVRGYLVDPQDGWLRRSANGFLHGNNKFAAVMDFAATQVHPADPSRRFVDQTPAELTSRAATSQMECHADPCFPHDGPVPEELLPMTTKKASTKHFPLTELPELLSNWPFLQVKFLCPSGVWSTGFLPDRFAEAQSKVGELLLQHLETNNRRIGFVMVPDLCSESGVERLGLAAYVSTVCFHDTDVGLVGSFRSLKPDEQQHLLAAFFRHPLVAISVSERQALEASWREYLATVLEVDSTSNGVELVLVQQSPEPLARCLGSSGPLMRALVQEHIGATTLVLDESGVRYKKTDGSVSKPFKSCETLGQHFDRLLAVRAPEPRGFFHNRYKHLGYVARQAVDLHADAADLRAQGEEALKQLCSRGGHPLEEHNIRST